MKFACPPLCLGLLVASLQATAQVAPDAGQSIRNIEQRPLPLPEKQSIPINLPDAPVTETVASGPRIKVASFVLSGNQGIRSDELLAPLTGLQGQTLSLAELQLAANRITRLYRERGYPLARAYLPAQDIDAGVVTIAVLEGRFGDIQLHNHSRVKDRVLASRITLNSGQAVRARPLEHSLLQLADIPGIEVKSILRPGASVGASDLIIEVQPGPLLSGSVVMDNYGNHYTGEYRLGGSLNVNSPLGLGDRLSMTALGSDKEQQYGRIAYQLPVGRWATRLGVAYSDMDYQLAEEFAALEAHGNARITSALALQTLIRSRDVSVYARLQFDDKRLKDDIDLFASQNDKRARVLIASVSGNSRDDLLGGGINSFELAWSRGSLNIDGQANQLIDALTAGTQGRFNKINPSLVRLQHLSDRFNLYGQLQGQWADGNLDSSEKISLGGAYGVRAYPQGEASGDQGWLANIELRYALTPSWRLSTFVDHGQVHLNKDTWSDDDNHRSLSAAGLGTTWTDHGWRLNAVAAWKIGNADPLDDQDRTPWLWAQLEYLF